MAGSNTRLLYQKLVFLVLEVSIYIRSLFRYFSTYIFRLQEVGSSSLNKNGEKINFLETEPGLSVEQKDENVATEFRGFDDDDDCSVVEEEEPGNYLKFKFPTYEEFSQSQKGTDGVLNSEVVSSVSTNKYEFTYGKSCVSAFVDEMEIFPVNEIKIDNFNEKDEGFSDRDFEEVSAETGLDHHKGKEISVLDGEENEKSEAIEFTEKSEEKAETVQEEERIQESNEFIEECQILSEKNSVVIDSDSESTSFEHIRSVTSRLVDSYSDGFLSDGNFVGEWDVDDEIEKMESGSDLSGFEENQDLSEDFDDEDSDIMEELKKLQENDLQNRDELSSDFLQDKDFNEDLGNIDDADVVIKDDEGMNGGNNSEKSRSKDSSMSDSEDVNKLESLWEHQEIIEQLKMELKKVRATGLPTILEESESPKISDDLKPWKIHEFQREDCIGELHKFYKSYIEKMRKFDIVNYQKMYAMG